MKHISGLTRQVPVVADDVQDIICIVNGTLQDLAVLKGDSSTSKDFIQGKCDASTGGGA